MKQNESKSNRNLTNQNESKSNRNLTNQSLPIRTNENKYRIQYKTYHYNIQYNAINTIIQIEKKQMKPKEIKSTETKENKTQYNTIIITLQCITLY